MNCAIRILLFGFKTEVATISGVSKADNESDSENSYRYTLPFSTTSGLTLANQNGSVVISSLIRESSFRFCFLNSARCNLSLLL